MERLIRIVCFTTQNYLPIADGFLNSSAIIKTAKVHCVCYKFEPPSSLIEQYPHVTFSHLAYVPSETYHMIQHGRFLDGISYSDDDIICLCDADVKVQRDFTDTELSLIQNLAQNTIAVGYNEGPTDTLGKEADRISYAGLMQDGNLPIYNLGTTIGHPKTFRRVQVEYEKDSPEFYKQCFHKSKGQFQFWRAWHRMPGEKSVVILPNDLAQHNHYRAIESPETVMFLHEHRNVPGNEKYHG
jgi:hypothetical protein